MIEYLFYAWCVLGSLAWLFGHVQALRALRRLPCLDELPPPPATQDGWPRLSVIIAARDEAETIEATVAGLLASDYPELELVLVDDRSRDGTGERMEALAAAHPGIRVLHLRELPDGWLGKVHALHRGQELATGDWLLFCDADTRVSGDALRRAVHLARSRELDHLAVWPRMIESDLLQGTVIAFFGLGFLGTVKAHRLASANEGDAYAGVGAFNLVRAHTLRRSEGFPWLKLEIADDVGLGLTIRRAGGRIGLAVSRTAVQVAWYPSLRDMTRGLEKNLFPVMGRFRIWLMAARVAGMVGVGVAPWLALGGGPLLWPVPVAAVLLLGLVARGMKQRVGMPPIHVLLQPIGLILLTAMAVRSTWRCTTTAAVEWRDTRYPLTLLRAGQRVRL
jgi:GT2 family glycosyltransferase